MIAERIPISPLYRIAEAKRACFAFSHIRAILSQNGMISRGGQLPVTVHQGKAQPPFILGAAIISPRVPALSRLGNHGKRKSLPVGECRTKSGRRPLPDNNRPVRNSLAIAIAPDEVRLQFSSLEVSRDDTPSQILFGQRGQSRSYERKIPVDRSPQCHCHFNIAAELFRRSPNGLQCALPRFSGENNAVSFLHRRCRIKTHQLSGRIHRHGAHVLTPTTVQKRIFLSRKFLYILGHGLIQRKSIRFYG